MTRSPPAGTVEDVAVRQAAHDLNNLLTAILGAAGAALERPGLDAETRADLESIREGARRGSSLARGFHTDAGRGEAPVLASVNACLRATLRLLAQRLGGPVALTASLTEPDGPIRVDPAELDRAVMNLAINARQAMPSGGTIRLSTEHRVLTQATQGTPDTVPPGGYVVITVADTGPGIPAEALPRLFEAGFTTGGGSGLGLSSVRAIIARCGGFLAVESGTKGGAVFEMYLPRLADASVTLPDRNAPAAPDGARGTVLLVEDDPLVRTVTERALHRMGWDVRAAESAEAALAWLDADGACDLMLTDLEMPGMDGAGLARRARSDRPGLPVILASGYATETARDALGDECVTFLDKPYGQEELRAAVARVMTGR